MSVSSVLFNFINESPASIVREGKEKNIYKNKKSSKDAMIYR